MGGQSSEATTLRVFLFGKFRAQLGEQVLTGLKASRVQELFCYLLLNRDRPHPRETLAGLLWGDTTTAQSKAYLRKALWQLQAGLDSQTELISGDILVVDADWVQINPRTGLWLDVAEFEQAFALVQGIPDRELESRHVQTLRDALDLYQGDLLEGWYQDWCLYERERLQNLYLTMLDKLMGYCEIHHDREEHYEIGVIYGTLILRCDRARERTHRRLMRLHYLAGNRTAALRQYELCVAALKEELGVEPSRRTTALCEQIRADKLDAPAPALGKARTLPEAATTPLTEVAGYLRHLREVLANVQQRVQGKLQEVEHVLDAEH
jgi:DNA-binding SARP family transcriptional activator